MAKNPIRPVWRRKGEDGPRDLDMPVLAVRVIEDGRRYYFYQWCYWMHGYDLTLYIRHGEVEDEFTYEPFDDYDFWLQIPKISNKRMENMLYCRSIEKVSEA